MCLVRALSRRQGRFAYFAIFSYCTRVLTMTGQYRHGCPHHTTGCWGIDSLLFLVYIPYFSRIPISYDSSPVFPCVIKSGSNCDLLSARPKPNHTTTAGRSESRGTRGEGVLPRRNFIWSRGFCAAGLAKRSLKEL